MNNEPPHFARPVHFGNDNVADQGCSICEQPITLWTRPDGTKVWRHVEDVTGE